MDQNKRAWLNRYIVRKRRVDRLYKMLGELEAGSGPLSSGSLSGMPRSKRTTSTTEEIAMRSAELKRRIGSQEKQAEALRSEILLAIDGLENPIRAEVLERHFILDESLNNIAYTLNYSERHVIRLLSRAIDEIQLPLHGGVVEKV